MRALAMLLAWAALAAAADRRILYWIEPCTDAVSGCRASDLELARWAMSAWQAASNGKLALEETARRDAAGIRLVWAGARTGAYGETRGYIENGVQVAEVYVRPAIVPPEEKDVLLRDAVVYLTCVHETGHALGLPHTADFADIMYSFQYGGDIREYFARYRRQLETRDDIRRHSGLSDADRKSLARAVEER